VRPDGTATAGPFNGNWQRVNARTFTLTWPEPVDTLALSADGDRLSGSNQYGVPVVASRVSGGPDLPGQWKWGGVADVLLDASGSATLGPLTGRWQVASQGQRLYRVTWPKIQETMTMSDDGARIQGGNQYGVTMSGTRLATCG
jgi:hypothetical protein